MQSIIQFFELVALVFDMIALVVVLFAGISMLKMFFRTPKVKGNYALKDRDYHDLRGHFTHRIILALDLFIVADLVKIAFLSDLTALLQILVIVIIRTILSHFLLKHSKARF
ncbi:MAG: DUF1622 domain-containing protein [bacterium]|nr:DUF1622 domain-containing protein [bacterium]